jgi:tRNA-binding EMAP/Myf-like protein
MEEMMDGRFVMVWANLKIKKLAGVPSHGMVLCASNADHTICQIVRPPHGSKLGERVCVEGRTPVSQEPAAELNPKKKVEPKFCEFIMTDADCNATYNGLKMTTSGGYLTVPSNAKCMIS